MPYLSSFISALWIIRPGRSIVRIGYGYVFPFGGILLRPRYERTGTLKNLFTRHTFLTCFSASLFYLMCFVLNPAMVANQKALLPGYFMINLLL